MNLETENPTTRAPRKRTEVTTIAVCDATDMQRTQIHAALAQIAELTLETIDPSPKDSATHGTTPQALIIILGTDQEMWALQIGEWLHYAIKPAIIAVVEDRSGMAVRQALRAGADEVVFMPVESSDLARCLVKIMETRQTGAARSGIVCSLTSVAGGVGVSSITAALGFALKRLTHKRIALVDLGLQCSALATILDLAPDHTVADLADPTSTVDSIRLESVLCTHESGLYLLAAPKRIEESEMISVSTITATLTVMRELFDFVLVDCGHHMNEGLVSAWEQSQHLLYMVDQSVTSVRPARRFLDLFGRLGLNDLDLQLILNRYDQSNPFSIEKIETALKRPLTARIPRDDEAFLRMQLEAADLAAVAAGSLGSIAVENIARQLCGNLEIVNGRHAPAFFSRLRSAVGL